MRLDEEVVVQLLDHFEGAFLADALLVVGGAADDLDGDEDAAGRRRCQTSPKPPRPMRLSGT